MRAIAIAQPNIALIKYWGKRDLERNLPAVGSISVTLEALHTTMSVAFDTDLSADTLSVNGKARAAMLPRVAACLDAIGGPERARARVSSDSNFPIAAGLASSASSFAALTVAAAAAAGIDADAQTLARLAGSASGSAARSLFGGFVELVNEGNSIRCESLREVADWPLSVVVAITEAGPKPVGSTEAMEISRATSPFYNAWVDAQPDDLRTAREAIAARDFGKLAAVAEHNCLKMHSVMWSSRPPTVFWNAATLRCLETVRTLQTNGCDVFFTIDAGPQVKAVCLPSDVGMVRDALQEVPGVTQVMTSGLGAGARRVGCS